MFSCKSSTQEEPGESNKILTRRELLSANPQEYLLGAWIICSEGGDQGIIQYSICPELIFGLDNEGSIFKAGIITESIKWDYKEDTLYLNHAAFYNKDTSQFFPDVNYIIKKSEDSSFVYVTIRQPTKKYFLNLSRSKRVLSKSYIYD